jgi:hypothetical protein
MHFGHLCRGMDANTIAPPMIPAKINDTVDSIYSPLAFLPKNTQHTIFCGRFDFCDLVGHGINFQAGQNESFLQ